MPNYRRAQVAGACWFFTVNLQQRQLHLLTEQIDLLKSCIRRVHRQLPFCIDAWVVLPDHMHCIWTLPEGDNDFPGRWRDIKKAFSRAIPDGEYRAPSRDLRRERGIWQRHYWEHLIRDASDYQHHVDYVHRNPLKHGWVQRVQDWPHSTFHRYVAAGVYSADWCGDGKGVIQGDA